MLLTNKFSLKKYTSIYEDYSFNTWKSYEDYSLNTWKSNLKP